MRIDLPGKQADGTALNWVDVREPDDFLAEDLFAIHRAVRITTSADGSNSYSPREMDDDAVNAFLSTAITAWSFPSPIPSQVNVAAGDKVIGRAMKAKDYAALRRAVRPLIDELEGVEREEETPKAAPSAS